MTERINELMPLGLPGRLTLAPTLRIVGAPATDYSLLFAKGPTGRAPCWENTAILVRSLLPSPFSNSCCSIVGAPLHRHSSWWGAPLLSIGHCSGMGSVNGRPPTSIYWELVEASLGCALSSARR